MNLHEAPSSSSGCCGVQIHLLAPLQVGCLHFSLCLSGNAHKQPRYHHVGSRNYVPCTDTDPRNADDALKSRDSSVKRNTSLVKKLRGLSEDTWQAVLDDIQKVNQSKVRCLRSKQMPANYPADVSCLGFMRTWQQQDCAW